MGTRSTIARKTQSGFTGVYHHWDGYPSGLGATLFELFNGHFKQDMSAMLKYLIDDHPAGWSTINGADFNMVAGFHERGSGPCNICGCPMWMHYSQYYADKGLPTPPSHTGKAHDYAVFNHRYIEKEQPRGPECYCHGQRKEKDNKLTEETAGSYGCEWAYVFEKKAGNPVMHVLSSYHPSGGKMVGFFGCGNPDSKWYSVGVVPLLEPEPDWQAIENYEPVQPVLN